MGELPQPRPHTAFADRAYDTVGGTAAGKALNLAALGHEVHLHTLLGADDAGERVRAGLERPGVTLHVAASVTGTEQHVNLMAADGGRLSIYRSVCAPDADLDLAPLAELAAECDAVVLDIADYARRLVAPLAAAGIGFGTDLHDWDGSSTHARDFADAARWVVLSDGGTDDPDGLARRLAGQDRLVVCTHGARGATAYDGAREVAVPAAPATAVVDTNGAGDAFCAGLLHGLHQGWPLERSVRAGTVAGATAVEVETLASPRLTAELLDTATAPTP
ncbi:MAG: carbohydrate kinase family protein [Nocardioidaceae bacterium]